MTSRPLSKILPLSVTAQKNLCYYILYPQLVHDRRFNLVAQDVTLLASGKSAIMENGGGTKDGIVSNGNAFLDNVPLISIFGT